MNEWDVLKNLCPRLFKHGITFECGFGWYGLLRNLSTKIESLLAEEELEFRCAKGAESEYRETFATQVKEKYGTLRFYMSCETEEITELIREAEALSSETCERCGAPGKMRDTHWFEVRCRKCF